MQVGGLDFQTPPAGSTCTWFQPVWTEREWCFQKPRVSLHTSSFHTLCSFGESFSQHYLCQWADQESESDMGKGMLIQMMSLSSFATFQRGKMLSEGIIIVPYTKLMNECVRRVLMWGCWESAWRKFPGYKRERRRKG